MRVGKAGDCILSSQKYGDWIYLSSRLKSIIGRVTERVNLLFFAWRFAVVFNECAGLVNEQSD